MNRLIWWTHVVVLLAMFGVSLPSATDAQPAGKKTRKVPGALVDFGEFAENIYDFSKAGDWAKASEKFKALKDAAEALPGDLDLEQAKLLLVGTNDFGKTRNPL